ncbi:uncharacterized protein C1A6.01c [Argentina anserina]|uniref:uncharacterized protein C1A6.01c n=1 Tax=Argentina anserina TaxID=57926 RepID=UPI0021766FFC|nr:uncharacterized protein C1A6.01c [Potentilla anserina]
MPEDGIGFGLGSGYDFGLVSYCELADPRDAKEYLDNIIGQEVGKSVIEEYLQKSGRSDLCTSTLNVPPSSLQAYVKPSSNEYSVTGTKKQLKTPKVAKTPIQQAASSSQGKPVPAQASESRTTNIANQSSSKKKKAGKVVSLAEAAKGSIVYQQGKPCSCQARRHRLVSNCLSCGKIVCEQEGEGPCHFCGALVLREGSRYAGLDESYTPVVSEAEAAAEAYAKRLVEYDRDSAARTTVIDDQSDYFEIEGNSWLSQEEKKLLTEKREQIEEAEKAKRKRVVVTFDLFGRKVLLNEDKLSELESESLTLKPLDEREVNRIKPNPSLKVQPLFVDPGPRNKPVVKGRKENKKPTKGLCLEITGRVQHVSNDLMADDQLEATSNEDFSQGPSVSGVVLDDDDGGKCSLDYR